MEKYVIFGPIIIFFGFMAILVIGFLLLVGKLFLKGKSAAWIGEVVDKSHVEKDKDDSNKKEHFYSLKVKLENGEVHAIPAHKDFFDSIKVGDKLEKKKGELWPKKIS